jgi:hypothetical protein
VPSNAWLTPPTEAGERANHLITYYTTSLREAVGPDYRSPSLVYLSRFWYHPTRASPITYMKDMGAYTFSAEVRQSARQIFDTTVVVMDDLETSSVVERWQHYCEPADHFRECASHEEFLVPYLQPEAQRSNVQAVEALIITGYVGASKYSLLSPR